MMWWDNVKNASKAKTATKESKEAEVKDFLSFQTLPSNMAKSIERYAYEMLDLYVGRMCEQIVTRGFSFNNVKDPLKTESLDSLHDLQRVMSDTTVQSLVNKDTNILYGSCVSVSEIVKRKYIGNRVDMDELIKQRSKYGVGGDKVFYAFYFGQDGKFPTKRTELLGIVPVTRDTDAEGNLIFKASILGKHKEVVFDNRLVFSMGYAEYLNVFLLGFENMVMFIFNSKNIIGSPDYKIFTDTKGYLNKDKADYEKVIERLQPFIDGDTRTLIKDSGLELTIMKGEASEKTTDVSVDFAKEILSFLTNAPKTILFGEQAKGLTNSKEDDKMLQEEFLTTKARLDFLPILQTFCDIFGLEGRDNLDFNSYFESMRVLNLVKEFDEDIVDDAIMYKVREEYYKMLNMKGKPPPIERETEDDEETVDGDEKGV